MKLHELPYRVSEEKFLEDISFSIHKYIHYLPLNLSHAKDSIFNNQSSLNEKDLFGKYNALNFLLESYLFYQNHRFDKYPKDQIPMIDFLLIYSYLKKYGALECIPDWKRKNFYENIIEVQDINSWHIKFIPDNVQSFLSMKDKEQNDFIFNILRNQLNNNSLSNTYNFILLSENIENNKIYKNIRKI